MSSVNMSQHNGLTRPCIRFALGLDDWGIPSFGQNVTTKVIAAESEDRAEAVYIRSCIDLVIVLSNCINIEPCGLSHAGIPQGKDAKRWIGCRIWEEQ